VRRRDRERVRELLEHALECLDYIRPRTPDEESMICEAASSISEALKLLNEETKT